MARRPAQRERGLRPVIARTSQKFNLREAPNERVLRACEKAAQYEGRRFDLLMRALPVGPSVEPVAAIREWLLKGQRRGQGSGWFLSKKAVVLIDPASRRGEVIWLES